MEKNSKPICYGSLITLKNLENFHLCAQGFIDNSPYLVKQIRYNFSCAIFRIVPSSIYSVQNEIIEFTRQIREEDFLQKFEKLEKLEENLESEIKTNLQNYNSLKGTAVRYDSFIQLEHLQSHKFLTLDSKETAEIEKENLKVSLEDFPSANSHFRILHGYNYQKFSDGTVKALDKVLLEIMILDLRKPAYLHCSRSFSNEVMMKGIDSILIQDAKMEKDYFEVNISLDQKNKWVVSEFAPVTREDGFLACGEFIWMSKPEENSVLSVGKKKLRKGSNLIFTQNCSDTNGLWMVENADSSIGGLVEIGVPYRLRHISTGLYLAINSKFRPCLSNDCAECTLWTLTPLEADTKYIQVDELCLIINTTTQRTISISEINYQVSTAPCSDCSSSIDEDSVFKITRAGGEIVWETFFLLHCYPILKEFSNFIVHDRVLIGPDAFKAIHQFKKQAELIETCIEKLIQFCNNKLQGMIGIDNHYGEVQFLRQRMLKEQNFFEVLANILDIALKHPINHEKVLKATSKKPKTKKRPSKCAIDLEIIELKHLTKIITKIYELLTTLCRKNNDNQLYAYKFFPTFMKHIGLGLGAKQFMLSVLEDNEQLMLSINIPQSIDKSVDMIEDFFSLLHNPSKQMRVTIIDFFKSICVFKGQGVTANQEKVLKSMILNERDLSDTLPRTLISGNQLCIFHNGNPVPIESFFESGEIVNCKEDIIYFTKLLGLYSNMCVGRNFEVAAELLRQFPFEIIHTMMWNSRLSDDLRAVFCKLILNLYVDTSPREEVARPQLIKEFVTIEAKSYETYLAVDTQSNENSKRLDYQKVSDCNGQTILIGYSKENSLESSPLSIGDSQIYELLNKIFAFFSERIVYSCLTSEVLRLTAKLMKFDLLGARCTDFEKKQLIQNPKYPKNELDVVKMLKSIVPLLVTEARKTTIHALIKRHKSTKIEINPNCKENQSDQYVYLSSLLKDTGNIKNPLIRSAANLKNFVSSLKQNPFNGIELKSDENRIKLKIAKMLHYYLDCRQDFLLNNLVAWFNESEPKFISVFNYLPQIMKFSNKTKFNEYLASESFSFTCIKGPFIPDLNHLGDQPLLVLLIKAFTYTENYKVQSSLFRLIMRCYEQRKELLRNVSNLHPISTEADIELYYWLKRSVKTFMNYSEQSELWLKYWKHERDLQKTYFESFKSIMHILKNLEDVLFESATIKNGALVIEGDEKLISASRQKMMNYLDADNLVLALIKDGIHELISLYTSKSHEKHLNNLTELFELCFSFLTNFVKSNQQNQKRLYKSLHIFLQHLSIPLGQIELISEIFKENLSLIEKIDEKFLGIFKNSILRYGRRATFLEVFKTIQVVKEKAVPSIQRIILNMFVPEELDLFLLYMKDQTSPEFTFEEEDSANDDYYDEPYKYHAVLLEVLAKCGFGVTGMYFNEAKCQNIVTLTNVFTILMKAEIPDSQYQQLKIPMLDFFYNIYLDCEIVNMDLKTCENFLRYIYVQSETISNLSILPEDYLESLFIFLKILLKYRSAYIKKNDSFYYDSTDMKAIKSFLHALKANYHKIECSITNSKFNSVLSELCESVEIQFMPCSEETDFLHTDLEPCRLTMHLTRDQTRMKSSWSIMKEELIYSPLIKEKIEAEESALLTAIHFSSELDSELSFEKIVKSVINFVKLSRSQQPPLQVTINAIELLARILAKPIRDKYTNLKEAKKKLQDSMSGYGIVRVLFSLMCDSSIEMQVFKSLMVLCVELLDGGNEMVQKEIFLFFNNSPSSEVFFERIHQMFLDYIDKFAHGLFLNVKRGKVFKQKINDIKTVLRLLQLFCEGHYLDLQDYMRYQSRSRDSYDMLSDIISLLEILIEKKLLISFPVISQCFDTLTEFIQGPCTNNQESLIDGKFLEIVSSLLSLNEFSNPVEPYFKLQKLEVSDSESEGPIIDEEETKLLASWMIAHLKYKALITVLSLMEGRTDNYIATRLIRSFNLEILKENLKCIYIAYVELYGADYYDKDLFEHMKDNENYVIGSYDNKQDLDPKYYSLVIENGFMIYHLLKTFTENDDPESQDIIEGELDQLQKFKEEEDLQSFSKNRSQRRTEIRPEIIRSAISDYKFYTNTYEYENSKQIILNSTFKFFDMYTGRVEIVFNENIFRVYFSLPPQFRGLTEEVKENFHAGVVRDTDQTKLKFMLSKVDSIIEQISHEHFLLNAMRNNRIVHLIASKVYVWRDVAFALNIVLNILVLLSYSSYDGFDRMNGPSLFNYTYDSAHLSTKSTMIIISVLGIIQLVCSMIIVAFFLLKVGPLVARNGWKKHQPTMEFLKSSPGRIKLTILKAKQILFTIFYVLIDFHVLYHIAYTFFSVLGITAHPFYFSLLMLDILYRYRSLQNVVKSFIVPRKALLLTFCMMIIFMYIFAIIGFFYFQQDYYADCKTLFWCTIIIWDGSFKNNGMIGGFMLKYDDGDLHTGRFFYDNTFNILLDVIITGIVEGLIIDTFAALREEEERSSSDKENKCFVCGLERDFIERKTNLPFGRHTEVEHSEWNYILFLAYLKGKLETEYTGLESYVMGQVERGEVSWIPNHRAMGIKGVTESEEAENVSKINGIKEQIKALKSKLLEGKLKQRVN